MELTQIKKLIEAKVNTSEIILAGDGCNCEVTVISDEFSGKSLLARQRLVISAVDKFIKSGELHALSVKTFTTDEWTDK